MHLTFRSSIVVFLLLLGSCQLTLVSLIVPAAVLADQVFEILVEGTSDTGHGNGGCVVQLPTGFTVVGASGVANLMLDEQALLNTYVAEPGHYLAAWSVTGVYLLSGRLKIFVRAPANVAGGTIKVALAGQATVGSPYVGQSPAGVTNFAQITAPANVRVVSIVNVPPTPFAPDAIGLPFGQVVTWSGIAVGDLDGDGDDDLVATPPSPAFSAQTRAWFRTGAGWTESSTGLGGSVQRTGVAIGDFDDDGHADIVLGSGAVFFGNGAGTWTTGPTIALAVLSFCAATGDVNGDGRSDIAFGSWYDDYIQVFLGNANRTFTEASTGLPGQTGIGSVDLLLRDVTGDGHLDVVWNQVWAGDGLGNWTQGVGVTAALPWFLDSGDLDGDGIPELIGAYRGGSTIASSGAVVHRRVGANQWALVPNTGLPTAHASGAALLDFDRDGRLDVVVAPASSTRLGLEVWRNLGGMTFALVASSGLPGVTVGLVTELAVGDINGDTFPDVAAAISNEGLVVYQNWLGGTAVFGSGCAGGLANAPAVSGLGAPALGNSSFAVQVAGGNPNTIGLCWFGFSRHVWGGVTALPRELSAFGAPGCTLWTGSESTTWGLFDNAGAIARPLPIPMDPSFLRLLLFAQGAAHVPGGNPLAMAFTPGLVIRIE